MKTNYRRVDIALLLVILLFLFLPLLQSKLHFKKQVKPLQGAFTEAADTVFGWKGWFNERFQEKRSAHLNQAFGFRNYYVRLNNQVDFTLFHKINTEHVVLGKAGVFYEDDYIKAYYGKNFIGNDKIQQLAKKLKQAQEILKSKGVILEILFLPGKASFFPEFIPAAYAGTKRTSNYEALAQQAKKISVDVIDFNSWFRKMRTTSTYDLYPVGGIHWSNYGALLAFDSLRAHVEKAAGIPLREFRITRVRHSNTFLDPDNDIANALNLLKDIKPLSMPIAEYKWLEKPGATKPNALFIGDSYFWNWYHQGLVNNTFSDARFWYYNQTIYPDTLETREVKNLPFVETVLSNKVVVLMATESNIHDIGWGFADNVISFIKPGSSGDMGRRKEIYTNYFIQEIKNTAQWLAEVKKKALQKNISLDAMLAMDAEYLYDTKYAKEEVIAFTEKAKERIRLDEKWLANVKKKAFQKNISLDEMLELDAKYIYDMEQKGK